MAEAPTTLEGWYSLHDMYAVDWPRWNELSRADQASITRGEVWLRVPVCTLSVQAPGPAGSSWALTVRISVTRLPLPTITGLILGASVSWAGWDEGLAAFKALMCAQKADSGSRISPCPV